MRFKYSTRFVILTKNIVIKIPICRKGYLQAYNELKIYQKYKQVAPLAEGGDRPDHLRQVRHRPPRWVQGLQVQGQDRLPGSAGHSVPRSCCTHGGAGQGCCADRHPQALQAHGGRDQSHHRRHGCGCLRLRFVSGWLRQGRVPGLRDRSLPLEPAPCWVAGAVLPASLPN